jgi:hypothetical protein
MPLSLALALQVATTIGADGPLAPLKLLPGCERERDDDVVVCASRADRFRLPLPEERHCSIRMRTSRARRTRPRDAAT